MFVSLLLDRVLNSLSGGQQQQQHAMLSVVCDGLWFVM
jgi:ABC-type enterochelin transport system ATPase subunit